MATASIRLTSFSGWGWSSGSHRAANRDALPTPIAAKCDRSFRAVKTQGKREPGTVLWIVLHDEEASTAESAARFFTTSQAGGSAHLCVDDEICYRTLDNDDIAQGARGANTHGFHIEQAGFAKWSTVVWLRHRRTLERAAYKTALHCVLFNIPPTFRFARHLEANRPGVTTHRECSQAFGGDHSDPGPFWPRRRFMRLVRAFHAELNV
jgi:N-acetyl-anhydromuramyl-L-alanine amidase AmpD